MRVSFNLNTMSDCPFVHDLPCPPVSVQPLLEHGDRVGGIRRPRLRHVPVLDNACPLHPVNVCQRNGFLARLVHTHVDEADVVVETLAEDCGRHKRDDCQSTQSASSPARRLACLGKYEDGRKRPLPAW